jgi:hypothetical protein
LGMGYWWYFWPVMDVINVPINLRLVTLWHKKINHHCFYGLFVLAGCDAHCQYNIFSCMFSGTTKDWLAWDTFLTGKAVEYQDDWLSDFHVIDDEASVCTDNHLIHYDGCSLGLWKDTFKFYPSSKLKFIECPF